MDDVTLRLRYTRMLNLMREVVRVPEPDEEDAYYARYDAAIENVKKLIAEEDKAPVV